MATRGGLEMDTWREGDRVVSVNKGARGARTFGGGIGCLLFGVVYLLKVLLR